MKAVLRLPTNLVEVRREVALPHSQRVALGWPVTVGPSALDEHTSQMRVTGLGDRALSLLDPDEYSLGVIPE